MPVKLLVVEDEKSILKLLRTILTANKYEVVEASTGAEALSLITSHCPDLILLDLGLPDMDGNTLLSSVRKWTSTPVIVLSARTHESDKVEAIDLGADDYITKPFGASELLARIRMALRHTQTMSQNAQIARTGQFHSGGLTIDYNKYRMIVAGASAYPRAIDFARLREIADEAGALLMVDMAHIAGLVAAGMHESPVPYADFVTTTTHKTLRGPRGGLILCREQYAKAIDKAIFPGTQGGPLMHVIAAKAVCFLEALRPEFKTYQRQIIANAKALENAFRQNGIRMVSDGTDNHLILMDLTGTGRTGKEMETLLGQSNITVNKNTIPGETLSPMITSGVRVGTPAVTTRGMVESDMEQIAGFIRRVLEGGENACSGVKSDVMEMMKRFPLYEGFPNA